MLPMGLPQVESTLRSTWQDLEIIGGLQEASLCSSIDSAYIYEDNLVLHLCSIHPCEELEDG